MQTYRSLLTTYLRPQGPWVIGLAVTLLANIALQLINPQILRYFIDTALAGGPTQALVTAALLFIGLALLTQALTVLATYLGEHVAWTATNALRTDLTEHCLRLDLAFHKQHTPGEFIERIDGDVTVLARFFSHFTIYILGNGLLLVGIVLMVFREDWRAGLGIGLFALLTLWVLLGTRTLSVRHWANWRQHNATFFGFLGEQIAASEDVRAHGAVGYVMRRFHALLQDWLPVYHKARLTSTVLWASSVGLFTLGTVISLGLGAWLYMQGAITVGTVFLLYYYTSLLRRPMAQIREQLEDLQQADASIERIQELFETRSTLAPGAGERLPAGPLRVEFDHVWFGYAEEVSSNGAGEGLDAAAPESVLRDVTFELAAGQVLGLLGRTGSGKSTLARLLLRLYDPTQGEIRLGGVALQRVAPGDVPRAVGMVTQDVQIFQATVRENLTFFDPAVDDERLMAALAVLGLDAWVNSLPQGLETSLGADGIGLSAGEAQLLAFARVFLKDPGLVILDEASSRLDPGTEALIERAVDRLLRGRTAIVIAHRLATVQRTDAILVLDGGRVAEFGPRAQLAADPGSRFARLLRTNAEAVSKGVNALVNETGG